MADRKISELTNLTGANLADDDEFPLVDTSADETKAITFGEFKTALDTATGFVRITGDTMTGDLTTTGLTLNNGATIVAINSSNVNSRLDLIASRTSSNLSSFLFKDDQDRSKLSIAQSGDISFYEDTGTTPKFFWDASAESLGIGTSSPNHKIDVVGSSENLLELTSSGSFGTALNITQNTPSTSILINSTSTGDIVDFRDNGTTVFTVKDGGNVGIGTSSPATQASVQNSSTSLGLEIDTTSGFASGPTLRGYYRAGSSYKPIAMTGSTVHFGINDVEKMRIDSSGRVGIGDVPKASFTGHSILQVGGQAILGANDALSSTGQTYLTHNIYYDTSGTPQVFNTSTANEGTVYTQVDGVHKWSNSAATTGTPSVQERMRIDSSGNVGIGDNNPLSILHIGSGSDANVPITLAPASGGNIEFRNTSSTGSFTFTNANGSSEKMRLDASGNLLVGKSDTSLAVAGARILPTGQVYSTASGAAAFAANRLSSDGNIMELYKDTGLVGSIGTGGGRPYFVADNGSNGGGFKVDSTQFYPVDRTGAVSNGVLDLGYSSGRWKDLYLGGGVYLGGTGSANKLDDYEEGSYTPTVYGATTAGSTTLNSSFNKLHYTKIGRQVTIGGEIRISGSASGSGFLRISTPFTNINESGSEFCGAVGVWGVNHADGASLTTSISKGAAYLRIIESFDNASTESALEITDLANNAELTISITFLTS